MEFKDEDFVDLDSFILKAGQGQVNHDTTGKEVPLKTTASESPPKETLTVVGISDAAMGSQLFMPEGAVTDLHNRVGQDVIAAGIGENGGPQTVMGGAMVVSPNDFILKAEHYSTGSGVGVVSPGAVDPHGASVSAAGWVKPLDVMPTSLSASGDFGPRGSFATDNGASASKFHKGIDLGGSTGTPIKATRAGRVTAAGFSGGAGNRVNIDHLDGYMSKYFHMNSISVSAGDEVFANQVIGTVGNTGNSRGAHLHFEIHKDGTAIDPAPFMGL